MRFEQVDGNGLLPMRAATDTFTTAYAFRRFLQRTLPAHLGVRPSADPLRNLPPATGTIVPDDVLRRWPRADAGLLAGTGGLAALPIDHDVAPAAMRGGTAAADAALGTFLSAGLPAYAEGRNDPEQDVTSGLSPYLHFGHLSSHEVVHAVLQREGWLGDLTRRASGAREGWWGVGAGGRGVSRPARHLARARLQHVRPAPRRLRPVRVAARVGPSHARGARRRRSREHVYTLAELEAGRTHDPLWNAAQRQLAREGRIHNYLRMLWGKKILEWTASPEEALAVMIELNNRYALDGRDPNSYSGIFWVLGRYDRPWGPERAVFGTVRYMSSANTARKMRVKGYIQRYAPAVAEGQASLW